MPTTDDNIRFLYLILTQAGPPTVDWDPICDALALEKGAVTKRWSRLKQAVDKGEKPTASNYDFLWLMVKHSTRDKSYDWDAIAAACNSTKGACSKRYSRLKLAFERGDAVPSTPAKPKSVPVTPRKTPSKINSKSEDGGAETPTRTPKRKRTPAKKIDYAESESEEDHPVTKRSKSTPQTKPRPKNAFRASDEQDIDDPPVKHATADTDVDDEVLPASLFAEKFTHAREMADVLLDRKGVLTQDQRDEVEDMLGVFDDAV